MPDDRPTSPAISTSRVSANEIVRHSFVTVRRGFDPTEVRSYLELVSRELSAWEQRDEELRDQLAEALERAQHPVIDEASLTAALGQQSAQVLRNAHEEAARIALQAEQTAATLVREAQQQATEIMIQAESAGAERIAEAELAASAVRQDTDRQTAEKLAAARADGAALLERAHEQGRDMIDQAQAARRQVLTDMAHRRRLMSIQIEQFRAARRTGGVGARGARFGGPGRRRPPADDAARASAAEVGRRQPVEPGDDELFAEAEVVVSGLDLDLSSPAPVPGAPGEPAEPAGAAGSPAPVDQDETSVVARVVVPEIDEPARGVVPFDADTMGAEAPKAAPAKAPAKGAPPKAATTKAVTRAAPPAEAPTQAVPATPASHPTAADPVSVVAPIPPTPTDAVPQEPPVAESSVEDLFARLRAGRPDEAPTPPPTPAQGAATPPVGVPPVLAAGEAAPDAPSSGAPEAAGDDDPALARRAELLDPVVTKLARRLKRTLQDDQNRLLDQLRAGSGTWSDELLATEDDQRHHYAAAAAGNLGDAVAAGITFARAETGAKGTGAKPDPKVAEALADVLAGTIVALLRRRLAGSEVPAGSDDATERVGAAYREWRGERIERLVGDAALGAFSAGVLAATPARTGVRWVVGGIAGRLRRLRRQRPGRRRGPGRAVPHRPPPPAGPRRVPVPGRADTGLTSSAT